MLRVAVVVGDDVRVDAARIPAIIDRANAALGWRYGARFVLGEQTAPAVPAPGRLMPTASSPGIEILQTWQNTTDWRDADVVIAVVWNSRPRPLQNANALDVALWGPADPELLVLARKGAALVETPQEAYEKAATLEFCQAAAERVHPFEDAVQFEQGVYSGLARMAARHWRRMQGVDRLFCPVCGAESWVDGAPSTCVEHGRVLLFSRHRAEGIGSDNLLGVAFDGGRYPLHGRIGGGSFGAVYFSKRQPDGLALAVKVLRNQGKSIEVKRFEREVRLLEQVDHPNVVKIHDHGWEREGPMYAVMDYLPGRTLSDVLHLLDPRTLVDFLMQVLDGLSALHERGMVHRDLKPANIMLVDDPTRPASPPRPVLIDLGLGKNRESLDKSELTQAGMAMGTHNYMAPEQFENANEVDHRADLYSIAVILYRGLTGDPPFDFRGIDPQVDPDGWRAKWEQLNTLPPPAIQREDLPEGLVAAVERGLGKRPEQRFQSAAAFRSALAGVRSQWHQQWMEPSEPAQALPPPVQRPLPVLSIAPPKPFPGTAPVGGATESTSPSLTPPPSRGTDAQTAGANGSQGWLFAVVGLGLLIGAAMVFMFNKLGNGTRPDAPIVSTTPITEGLGTTGADSTVLAAMTPVVRARPAVAERDTKDPSPAEVERRTAEQARLAEAKAKAEQLAAEQAQAQADKLAAEQAKAKADKLAAEQAKADRAKAEKLAAEQAKADKLAAEQVKADKARADKLAAEQAKTDKAKADKLAAEQAKTDKAKADKLAAEQAKTDKARLAAEQAKTDKARAERLAAEQRSANARAVRAPRSEPEAPRSGARDGANQAPASNGLVARSPTSEPIPLVAGAASREAPTPEPRANPAAPAYTTAMEEAQRHIAARRVDQGIAALERAVGLRPQAKEPHQVLCRVQRMAGRQSTARQHCEAWRRLETSDAGRSAAEAQLKLLGP